MSSSSGPLRNSIKNEKVLWGTSKWACANKRWGQLAVKNPFQITSAFTQWARFWSKNWKKFKYQSLQQCFISGELQKRCQHSRWQVSSDKIQILLCLVELLLVELIIKVRPKNKYLGPLFVIKPNYFKNQCSFALSFYRSQNVLCRSKFFEPAQKFDCI